MCKCSTCNRPMEADDPAYMGYGQCTACLYDCADAPVFCSKCGAELTDDDIHWNATERDLSYPGEWEINRWCCNKCFTEACVDSNS